MPIFKSKLVNKVIVFKILISIYIIISFIYISSNFLNYFRINFAQKYLEQGRQLTIEQLIKQTEDAKCEPFYAYTQEKKVKLVNANCFIKEEKSVENPAAIEDAENTK